MAETNITKALLESILEEPILNFETSSGSEEGDNVASTLLSVVVTTSKHQTHNLICKCFPTFSLPDESAHSRTIRFFKIEHVFYNSALPLLESVIRNQLRNNNLGNELEYNLPVPKYYPNGLDPVKDANYFHTVWLHDLRPDGYKMMDKFMGLKFEETNLILNELGKFHATTYFLIRNHGESIFKNELPDLLSSEWLQPEMRKSYADIFFGAWTNAMTLLEKAGHHDWVETLKKISPNDTFDIAMQTAMLTDKKYFPVIIHGDFWTNNILIKFDESNKPSAIKFVDFQLSRRGNIYEELGYFMFTSTTPSFRSQYLTKVLQTYYNSFVEFLTQLGCPKPPNFTLGSFLDEFQLCILPAFVYMTFAIPLQLSTFSLGAAPDGDEKEDDEIDGTEMFTRQLYRMIDKSPRALKRLEDITQEMITLQIL